LNAGLWEVLLYTTEEGKKSLYYQGWFTFPLGHYKELFEKYNDVSYWKHWHRLEHWSDPEGTQVHLKTLRAVVNEREVAAVQHSIEDIIVDGEQKRKAKTVKAENVKCWGDVCEKKQNIQYATFIPPGRYTMSKPWGNEYERIEHFEKAIVRKIKSPGSARTLDEIELVFKNSKNGEKNRFIISGITLSMLPRLNPQQYSKGLYMPMGVSVPPFYQTYDDLKKSPPQYSPYFCLLLDGEGKWINHHDVAIDGPVIHRDHLDPSLYHIYLLSYERHSLVGHYTIKL